MTTTTLGRTATLLLAIPAIAFALSACAAQTPDADTNADPGGDTSTGSEQSSEPGSLVAWQAAYGECMRGQGIDQQDSTAPGEMMPGTGADEDAILAARDLCFERIGNPPPPTESEQAEMDQRTHDWAVGAAECYRELGYDMPDPKLGEVPQFPADASDDAKATCGFWDGSTDG